MAKRTEDPLEMIKADIEQKFRMACAEMAAEMTWRIESAYESVIQSFYDDYTPKYYERTYSTYLASDKVDDPFGFTPVDNDYITGINVDPSFINGNPYRAEKDWVFDRTFNKGIHGFFRWEYRQWANKQLRALNRKYLMSKAKKQRLKEYFTKTMNRAPKKYRKGVKTSFVYTTGNINSTSLKTGTAIQTRGFSYTPRKAMDAYFKKLTAKKEMDALFETFLDKYLNE